MDHYFIYDKPFHPKYGDVVQYGNYLYFYQPNGTMSYLYYFSGDVGIKAKKALSVHRTGVRQPDPEKLAEFLARDELEMETRRRNYKRIPPLILPEIITSDSESSEVDTTTDPFQSPG